MTERERLIELLRERQAYGRTGFSSFPISNEEIADYLLANGVIVPPCKVGDKIYIVAEITKKIIECTVIGAWICEGNCTIITDCGTIYNLSFEETVFLTKEEAEQALRKEDEGK